MNCERCNKVLDDLFVRMSREPGSTEDPKALLCADCEYNDELTMQMLSGGRSILKCFVCGKEDICTIYRKSIMSPICDSCLADLEYDDTLRRNGYTSKPLV